MIVLNFRRFQSFSGFRSHRKYQDDIFNNEVFRIIAPTSYEHRNKKNNFNLRMGYEQLRVISYMKDLHYKNKLIKRIIVAFMFQTSYILIENNLYIYITITA